MIRGTDLEGVYTDGERLYTRNSAPGKAVYGERLVISEEVQYREWVPTRSKLAAYVRSGGTFFPFRRSTSVLYLGAASGTTASHIADIVTDGTVYCVEISPRSFRDLVPVCESRPNMVPFLADATKPQEYSFGIAGVEVVYQDIAQRGQAQIFIKNFKAFSARCGLLVIKSRSEDVSQDPHRIYEESKRQLQSAGLKVREVVRLDPMEKDHAMIAVGSP
ncbi:MAG: fibrillarin-like rRNA/tRNA 2'-O-methyltransferase [Methanomassiliicoccus sp.]|jgi:fibrillarin-like pre-rRNA processing protein|nr:fibrillarin-like rRNA/tRNA 2'-O-methyltransferase [Methanomassiliicoccus sp.]